MFRRLSRVFLLILIACTLGACSTENAPINLTSLLNEEETGELRGITEEVSNPKENSAGKAEESYADIREDGYYYDLESVVLYYEKFSRLPSNYLTKNKARALGWERGRLTGYKEGAAIGGDRFGNYEGILPKVKGRTYYECDIDTLGKKKRGTKRIIYSSDGQIYYTGDHYETFELLYGEE